jgi:hypothetical protein
MKKQVIISVLMTLCLMICTTIGTDARADLGAQKDPQAAPRKQSKEKAQESYAEEEVQGSVVMWEDPGDLEKRDLFYGIGGKKGAPDLSAKFTFVQRKTSGGHWKKIIVEDDRDRRWVVKFGPEARPETVASRLVWAVGYHTDQDYFVKRAHIEGYGDDAICDVRFERDNDGFKKVERWSWDSNPFVGTRELDGLKVLMALLNNFDLKTLNNKIVRPSKKKGGEATQLIYYVSDLGATLGSTGKWFTSLPLFGELPAGTQGKPKDFVEHRFIADVSHGLVSFHNKRQRASRALEGVRVENARWMGNLLARLSDKQLSDAFRAGGFDEAETAVYLRAMRDRISQLKNLK